MYIGVYESKLHAIDTVQEIFMRKRVIACCQPMQVCQVLNFILLCFLIHSFSWYETLS